MTVPGEVGTVIRLYDFASGRLVSLLKGHTAVVSGLAFSPDSNLLISGSGQGDLSAIIWDVEKHRALHRLRGHTQEVYAVGFTPDGQRAVTGSLDGTLRLWSARDGTQIGNPMTGHKDKIRGIAISPDGMIASGSLDGEIRLWDGKTGAFIKILANQGTSASALRFTRDGTRLISTCGRGHPCHEHVWEIATGNEVATHKIDDDIVITAATHPDGKLAATGGGSGHELHVWELATGKTLQVLKGTGRPRWATGFSPDGHRIAWGSTWRSHTTLAKNPLEFELRLATPGGALGRPARMDEAAGQTFVRARTVFGAYSLSHRKGGSYGYDAFLDIKKDGKTVASIERRSSNGYQHRAYTFTPDGQTIISAGDNGVLAAYNLKGEQIGEFIGHESDVWAVTPSPDGRLLVSGSADHTVRLWNIKTRELITTLFYGVDGEWVMWTPQGYYTGSAGSDKIVGWQINRGVDQAADVVGADQLRQHLNRPDIVERAIILGSADAAVREAPGTTFQLADLLKRPVPRFRVVSPTSGSTEAAGRAIVKLAIENTPDPVKAIRVQVNGRQIEEQTPEIDSGGFAAGEHILSVPLGNGRNEIRVSLSNAIGEKAESLVLMHEGEGDLDRRGTLFILAIGVDKYPGLGKTCGDGTESCDLKFSSADARALVGAVEERLKPSHSKVVKRILINGGDPKDAPTASNILEALDILRQTQENDTVLLFIAGHGFNDGPYYRFLPTNAERLGDAFRSTTVVSWQVLQEAIERAKGRRIMLMDTCHSGNAYNRRLDNTAYHANIIAYTSADFDQEAMEDPSLGHGLFTYAVVEGLEGKGSLAGKREISTKELAEYVVKRVSELAKKLQGNQTPQYLKARDAEDYVLARW
jgi:WD40 repeat protein